MPFFGTTFGLICFWVIVGILCIILLYILANTVAAGILKIFGIEDPGLENTADYEVLRQLADSGYNTLMDSEELQEYLNYEYAVLMDAARFVQETGVYVLAPTIEGEIDLASLTPEQRARFVAAQLAGDEKTLKDIEDNIVQSQEAQNVEKYYKEALDDLEESKNKIQEKIDDLDKRIAAVEANQELTKEDEKTLESLKKRKESLEKNKKDMDGDAKQAMAFFYEQTKERKVSPTQFKKKLSDILHQYLGREAELTNTDSGRELFFKVSESTVKTEDGENTKSLVPYLRIFKSASLYTYYFLDGENNDIIVKENGEFKGINKDRQSYIEERTLAANRGNAEALDELTAFAAGTAGYYYNADLNTKNRSLFTHGMRPETGNILTMTQKYERDQLYYQTADNGSATYEIPFKVLIDRFLPKATLLSSWYMLKDSTDNGDVDQLLTEFKKIYNEACLAGEGSESVNTSLFMRVCETFYQAYQLEKENKVQIPGVEIFLGEEITEEELQELTRKFEKMRNEDVVTNEYSFIEFERYLMKMTNFGKWEYGETEVFTTITDLVHGIDLNAVSANSYIYAAGGSIILKGPNGTAGIPDLAAEALKKALSGDLSLGGYKLVPLSGKGIVREAVDGEYDLSPIEYPAEEEQIAVDGWYYVEDEAGNKVLIDEEVNKAIRTAIQDYARSAMRDYVYGLISDGYELLDNEGNPITLSQISVTVDVSDLPEPKAVFTVEQIQFGITQEVTDTNMPMYFPKYATTWSREIKFYNDITTTQQFQKNNINFLGPLGGRYACGFKRIDISNASEWRTKLIAPIFKNTRENDVIAMLTEWEEVDKSGVTTAANTYIRDLYELIEYSKDEVDEFGQPYVQEENYHYIHVPDETLYFDEDTIDLSFWMDHFMSTTSDPIEPEENLYMRSKLDVTRWQQVDYELYEECKDEETGKYKVYALWPEGGYLSKSHYALSANASFNANEYIESWGGWKYNGSHPGVDLYGRDTADNLARNCASIIKSKISGDEVILTDGKGNPLYGDGMINIIKTNFGLYARGAVTTLVLDGKTYYFPGTGAATFGYELYRLTKVYKDADKASTELVKMLQKEAKETPIIAVAPGIVKRVEARPGGGFNVTIAHTRDGETVTTTYLHMKRWPKVQEGQYVGAGTILGYEGTTGNSKGVHLHFELNVPSEKNLSTMAEQIYPIPFLYPFFSPFYNEEKAAGEGVEVKYDMSDQYMSIIRTVYPYGQKVGAGIDLSKPMEPYLVDERKGYTINQVEADKDGFVKIKNYVPTMALLDDASELPFMTDERISEGFLEDRDKVERIGGATEEYEDVQALDLYWDSLFLKIVARFGGYIFTGEIPYENYIFDNPRGREGGKPLVGEGGLNFTVKQWRQYELLLAEKVLEAGYGSRAGVVAAARFLAGMPVSVPYLGQQPGSVSSDVGIYARIGLNATWGQRVTAGGRIFESNGFDCTGFVNWCLINGGVKPELYNGDGSGAGLMMTMKEAIKQNLIRPGDLVYTGKPVNGMVETSHIGIIIGMDNAYVYIAEEVGLGLRITKFDKAKGECVEGRSPDADNYVKIDDGSYNFYPADGNMDKLVNTWYDVNGNVVGTW